ncbi:hypothetical protein Ae331Ps2_0091 [Pseudonocardia sp. Ae331_Ps2]|nr:hypothetical protein Ae331Ps2_0091 [Pseudonocardia sp. Ae331_Ps2]
MVPLCVRDAEVPSWDGGVGTLVRGHALDHRHRRR